MPTFGLLSLQVAASDPSIEISDQIESLFNDDDEEAEEELEEVAQSNQGSSLKRRLSSFTTQERQSQDAYLSLHRQVTTQASSNKAIVGEEPVKIGDRALREHRFYITQTNYQNAEQFTVRSTFGDGPEIAYSFGQSPRMWQFSGILRRGPASGSVETQSNNWWQALEAFYRDRLRASLLMKNNEFIRLRVGKLSIRGYITNFSTSRSQTNDDAAAQFRFSMYVRSYNFADGYEYVPSSEKLAADQPVFEDGEDLDDVGEDFRDPLPTDPSPDNIT